MNRWAYCSKCHKIFETEMLHLKHEYGCDCPTVGCDGEAFGIDEEMLIPIAILNDKGYETRWSCSGHVFDEHSREGYIAFSDQSTFPKTVPDGWYADEEYKAIRYQVPNKNAIFRRKAIVKHIDNLIEWAVKLPQNNIR